jgi:hypothetical protein
MRALCEDIVGRTSELSHVRMRQVAISFARCRKDVSHGLQASLTPLRFAGGHLVGWHHGRLYATQRVEQGGCEMLYILTFYLPRFMNLPFDEKLTTILHELWHIGPRFDGDLRRFPGRCYLHTRSERQFDQAMAELARRWLDHGPARQLYEFLYGDFAQLSQSYRRVVGARVPHPKLILVSA